MGLFFRNPQFFKNKKTFTADEFIFKFLRNGAMTQMNVNGSVTPVNFRYTVPAGKQVWLHRLHMTATNTNMSKTTFFGEVALTNGLTFQVHDQTDALLIDFLDGEPITVTHEFGALVGVDIQTVASGAGNDYESVRWTIANSGEPLFMDEGSYIECVISDDLTGISTMKAMIQGVIVDKV